MSEFSHRQESKRGSSRFTKAAAALLATAALASCGDRDAGSGQAAARPAAANEQASPAPASAAEVAPSTEAEYSPKRERQTITALEQYAEAFAIEALAAIPEDTFASGTGGGKNIYRIGGEAGPSSMWAELNAEDGFIVVVGSHRSDQGISETFSTTLNATPNNYMFNEFRQGFGPVTAADFRKALTPDSVYLDEIATSSKGAGEIQASVVLGGTLLFRDIENGGRDEFQASDPAVRDYLELVSQADYFEDTKNAILDPFRD